LNQGNITNVVFSLSFSFIYDNHVSYGKGTQVFLAIQLFLVCVSATFLLRKMWYRNTVWIVCACNNSWEL